ncbi:MAG: SRPBCC domain-containing protein [Chloroflexia bacterium]|nr:SRPBCC domain-containing protein [Chloroflexia bacterium]
MTHLDTTAVSDRIKSERMLPVPPERVWVALTDPAERSRWCGTSAEVDLRPGGAVRFTFGTSWDVRGIIEEVEPPSRLVYSWDADEDAATEGVKPPMTRVEILLDRVPGGTRLRLVESGFGALPAAIRDSAHEGRTVGWTQELDHLVTYAGVEG